MTINYALYIPNIIKKIKHVCFSYIVIQLYLYKATAMLNLKFQKIVTLRMSLLHLITEQQLTTTYLRTLVSTCI